MRLDCYCKRIGGVIGMLILEATGGILIIPGLVPHFFCGATAGIYGNAMGDRRGAALGAFVNALAITFLPAWLLPVLGKSGFQNTTFGDADFGVLGILQVKLDLAEFSLDMVKMFHEDAKQLNYSIL